MSDLRPARAHWVTRDTVAWRSSTDATPCRLHAGQDSFDLIPDPLGLPEAVRSKFPHLSSLPAFRIPEAVRPDVPELLKKEIFVSAADERSDLQIPGVLDDLFGYVGPLGVSFEGAVPTLGLWAPTAKRVTLLLFQDDDPRRVEMSFDMLSGVWSVTGRPTWNRRFYQFEVEVFVRTTGRVETNVVTDPYSVSLSTNSTKSQIVNLEDSDLKPPGWHQLDKPPFERPEDIVLYELHVRDFSMSDPAVPPEHRGTFLAFTHHESFGMRHLRRLARAGLTHVHLLPVFDFATVNDLRSEHKDPGDLSRFAPDSEEQQKAVAAVQAEDGYNWGYDPLHYTVPEGSYSTEPHGPTRIREFRSMVLALANAGLRVVMDVVYNHTHAASRKSASLLDRVVPGYYHRLDADGEVEHSTCIANTASEHAMMEKLMIDSALTWTTAYKVDGFRVDLMGHHMRANMVKLQKRLLVAGFRLPVVPSTDDRQPATSNRQPIYIYGEGWDFGEVANNARGVNATQVNMAGTGIGTFNDRIRDAVRGGGPFHGPQEQGFATGLGERGQEMNRLASDAAVIRASLAANLKTYPGAANVHFRGGPADYTEEPHEAVHYVASHDNETLFDAIQLKAPRDASMADRVRMNNLAVSLVMLAQGIPFFHAGDELLRSKSLDRNSHDSGDWFNRIDYTLQSSNFGVGLPPAKENERNWPIMRPLLGDPALRPAVSDIQRAVEHFLEMLRIRKSTSLFRLPDARSVIEKVRFHQSEPGLIMMSIADRAGPDRELVAVAFNGYGVEKTIVVSDLAGSDLILHPEHQSSADALLRTARFDRASGTFAVPPRATVVFWGFSALG